jgi:hypothetical protein
MKKASPAPHAETMNRTSAPAYIAACQRQAAEGMVIIGIGVALAVVL